MTLSMQALNRVVEVQVPESLEICEDEGLFSPEVKGGREDVVGFR